MFDPFLSVYHAMCVGTSKKFVHTQCNGSIALDLEQLCFQLISFSIVKCRSGLIFSLVEAKWCPFRDLWKIAKVKYSEPVHLNVRSAEAN